MSLKEEKDILNLIDRILKKSLLYTAIYKSFAVIASNNGNRPVKKTRQVYLFNLEIVYFSWIPNVNLAKLFERR